MAFYTFGFVLLAGLISVQSSGYDARDDFGSFNDGELGLHGGINHHERTRRETAGAKPEPASSTVDAECQPFELPNATATAAPPECCACSDCKLGNLKQASIEKCEVELKPETDAFFAKMNAMASTNGSGNSSSDAQDKAPSSDAKGNATSIKSMQDVRECMTECVFRESGYLSQNFQLNENAIMKDFKNGFKDPRWSPIAQKTYIKCIEAGKKAAQGQKCKSGAEDFMQCLAREKYLGCPEKSWNQKDPECQKIKERLAKCPNLAPPY